MPLLTEGIRIHGEKLTEQLKPLHDRLSSCFRELKEKVEKLYGVITLVGFVSTAYELFLVSSTVYDIDPFFRCQMSQSSLGMACKPWGSSEKAWSALNNLHLLLCWTAALKLE